MQYKSTSALAALLGGVMLASSGVHAQVTELRMIEAGGPSGDSIDAGYINPFTEKTGIRVTRENPAGLGKVRAMVESGSITAPIVELSSGELEQAKALDLLEPLDWEAIDPDPIFEEAIDEYGLGWQFYSTILTWREGEKPLGSWADLWNVESFPGQRTLPDYPTYIIPMALLADGVAVDDLYPLDLDRAFAKLDEIKDHVSVWWEAGAQPPQLLQDNEVQYGVAWSGRVTDVDGVGYTFDQGQLDLTYFAIPKGTSDEVKEAVYQLMHEMTIAENQAAAAEVVSYTGPSKDLDPLLPQDRLDKFPTVQQNRDVQFFIDAQWWYENAEEVEIRWQEFKLGL
jgi:putative spermidine/putrescine transport system substrate-binding protein